MNAPVDKTLRTRLGRVRGLGSAKEGAAHWWAQRLTAIALLPLMIWLALSLATLAGAGHALVVAWIKGPVAAVLLIALIGALFYHLVLGLQVVIEDYVHTEWRKIALLVTVKFAAALCALIGLFSVLRIAFGA